MPERRRLSRHHRHPQKMSGLPFRKMSQHRHETGRYANYFVAIFSLSFDLFIFFICVAIREDRTRGGRSTYQCTYAVPSGSSGSSVGGMTGEVVGSSNGGGGGSGVGGGSKMLLTPNGDSSSSRSMDSSEWNSSPPSANTPANHHLHHLHHHHPHHHHHHHHHNNANHTTVPQLLLEIMNVEHLWHCNEQDGQQQQQHRNSSSASVPTPPTSTSARTPNGSDPAASVTSNGANPTPPPPQPSAAPAEGDSVSSLCSIADHRLYKIVKWCKSLPLFKNIQVNWMLI